jgi:transitional endoplasmic reticulum ATPase
VVINSIYNSYNEKINKKLFLDYSDPTLQIYEGYSRKYNLSPSQQEAINDANIEIKKNKNNLNTTKTSFDSIAGQSRAVVEAKKLVLAINHPEIYEKRGVKTPKGILFYGPPGTGKTLIAKAIALEVNAELFEVSFSDIGSKWYGESEKRIQEIFDQANNVTKSGGKAIILFDELDSMAPSRTDSYEGSKKIVSIILQNLDGFRSNKNVLIIGTTNRPEDIDSALKRPGRIDKIIPVDLPDLDDRKAILELHINKAKGNASESHDLFSPNLDTQKIAESTEGMSGADLANIINLTLETKTVLELEGLRWTPISNQDMERTLIEFDLKKKEKNKIGFNL